MEPWLPLVLNIIFLKVGIRKDHGIKDCSISKRILAPLILNPSEQDMAHLVKDFFTGSLIVVALAVAALLGSVLFFILNFFFHMFAAVALVFLFISLLFFTIWLIGYVYRQVREPAKKHERRRQC